MMKEKNWYWKSDRQNHNRICIISILILVCLLCFLMMQIFWKNHDRANHIFYKSVESIVELKASDISKGSNYGTAIFMDNKGTLVTNAHVILYRKNGKMREYQELQIRLPMEDDYRDVSLVKYDVELDIAVLQLEDKDFTVKSIDIGNSEKLDYGDKIFSVGNTMNYGISISEGIISVPLIEIEYDGMVRKVIQSDINIASGNSGGALLNEKGQLIGITTFRLKDNEGNIVYGSGFSVPIDKVIEYLNQSD